MFAYCLNNPVNMMDESGNTARPSRQAANGKSRRGPNSELANAPDLDIDSDPDDSYDCLGNAICKKTNADLPEYQNGESTEETFELFVDALGKENVRKLESIHGPIGEDEYMVALRCGPKDYHFIRLDGEKWYNKSGTWSEVYIDQSYVEAEIWYVMYEAHGEPEIGYPMDGYRYYEDEIIYFAIKAGWDES